jgi:predicted alpha-1,2-mannosidase
VPTPALADSWCCRDALRSRDSFWMRQPSRHHRARPGPGVGLVALAVALMSLLPVTAVAAAASATTDPAALVDTMVGTGAAPVQPGDIDTFPGASLPFGMIQWSPDTTPDRRDGGGYAATDHRITGFSLTHLSGPGCPYFGDVPILPTSGAVPADPEGATASFSHSTERASPGSYAVDVGAPATAVSLAVTARAGTGQFAFSKGSHGNLLFKAGDSAGGTGGSAFTVVGDDEVEGSSTGRAFCTTSGPYTVYFVAKFNRPFSASGTWQGAAVTPHAPSCTGSSTTACGGWVTFDTSTNRTVEMQVAISYVSIAGATSNLAAEHPGWNEADVARAATATWNRDLTRIDVSGGSSAGTRAFYTALYHSLLSPTVFGDDDGQYLGFDHAVHATSTHTQYTNFSEWDIYRTQFPLVALLFPRIASDMVTSLLNDAAQSGFLPRWPVAATDAGQTDGDSPDVVIAEAYAFGARDFDAAQALADMEKGASQPGSGLVQERQNLADYLQHGYVVGNTEDLTSYGYTLGTSVTLEYALDDFCISQLASALGQTPVAAAALQRSSNWQNVFDPGTGYVGARTASGAFVAGPAFQPTHKTNQGQVGFEEGNAIQYTWGVPQDLGSLFSLMGGRAAATAKLDTFFSTLNASRYRPDYWAGNEPDLWAPWEYDASGAPWRTQQVVHKVLDSQYSLTPQGEPGNDDLGALSAWYVWGSLGLYPLTPGTATLALATPAFPHVSIELGNGHRLVVQTNGPTGGYVHAARLAAGSSSSVTWTKPWLPASAVSGATLTLSTQSHPDVHWGAAPADALPSYGNAAAPAVGFTEPVGTVAMASGGTAQATLGVQSAGSAAVTVDWTAHPPPGMTVSPSGGQLTLAASAPGAKTARATASLTVSGASPGTIGFSLTTATGTALPPLSLDVASG